MPVLARSLLFCLALSGTGAILAEQAALPYLPANQFRLADYLPPPPTVDSSLQQSDLTAVLAAQAARSSAQVSRVQQDDEWEDSVFHFARESLGAGFSIERLPLTRAFFRRAQEDLVQFLMPAKHSYGRPRPYEASALVKPVLPPPEGDSYPSGHSMNGYLNATLLSMALPEKRNELFSRAQINADSRVIAGVHFPSDLEGGKISAAVLAARLLDDPRAAADFEAVKQEIRGALASAD
ncbi:phosphatase PAP2 family protein [Pseudomonas chlororaphis]|uniref:acid phosphatase n=1 Tax=Pseudomonas chlororaphis TaxID=587753 RepID=UPI000E0A1114|nr:phosphatase PAP2 family protein [Pseudomonas chlororaphis]AZD17423.1 putative acid phosphatase [Pseudomonas chlororaphis]WDH46000.1 phosphatase PAP2 family protein [Pseudomonas chlororaphis]WDH57847.1 phosphatase PAP2 family protein [Pseudomonas chlororaphis]WQE17104.1 phosphatase PAP2 family protein [Pseudomonas chlororaphis]